MEKAVKNSSIWSRIKKETGNAVYALYLLKSIIGTCICYAFYKAIPEYHLYWSIISLLLVLAPDWDNSIKLPLNRIKANLTGGIVGLLCFFIPFPQLFTLCLGVIATILVCSILNYSTATRSALAALVIVYIQEYETASWIVSLERIFSVILGSLVGLALTLLFHAIELKVARLRKTRKEYS
ncbi:FUSC family protein [uncultured Sphaerochaeta sp.]|uniref:FUSC family protein n=1 Tax=uncultured Sphaerochaeta sp. TaxID=886478 RepID=UPI002A0A3DE2|nr:FUSC family protein [uncultured Sphaerochaeta sp.]